MKVIELKSLGNNPSVLSEKVKNNEMTNEDANKALKDIYISYKDMILSNFELPQPGQSLTPAQMRLAIRIMDKTEAAGAGGKLSLTDDEHALLKPRIEGMTFVVAHKNIMQFIDDVVDAKEEVTPKTA